MSQTGQIQAPQKGQPIRASWAQAVTDAVNAALPFAVPGCLFRSGFGGSGSEALPENKRNRKTVSKTLPFTVKWSDDLNESEGGWAIYLPGNLLNVGGYSIDIKENLEAAESLGDDWYILAFLEETGGEVLLVVYKDENDEINADFTSPNAGEPEGAASVLATISISTVTRTEAGAVTVRQSVNNAIFPVITDGDSVDASIGALQLAHFADTVRDSGKGLVKRISVNEESGEIEADEDDGLMLVARKEGQIIYVPLSGDGEDPEAEEEDEPAANSCTHPGDSSNDGGVKNDDSEIAAHSSSHGGGSTVSGGVRAGGSQSSHPGDDNCNCPS